MKGLGALLMALGTVGAGGAFLLALSLGVLLLPNSSPVGVLWAWDGVLLGFLIFRVWGMGHGPAGQRRALDAELSASAVGPERRFRAQRRRLALAAVAADLRSRPAGFVAGVDFRPRARSRHPVAPRSGLVLVRHRLDPPVADLSRGIDGEHASARNDPGSLLSGCRAPGPGAEHLYAGCDPGRTRGLGRRVHGAGRGRAVDSGEASDWLLATNLALPPGWLAYGAYEARRVAIGRLLWARLRSWRSLAGA